MKHLGDHKTKKNTKEKNCTLTADCSGYSSIFDALFLLVLISLAGILLMSALQAEKQYSAAGYVTSSELDTYMLESLLSCKLDIFEYEMSPLSIVNVPISESSMVKNPTRSLFGKEQKHRTVADLTAEYLALSLKISNNSDNSSPILINTLAADYAAADVKFISAYLDQKAAGRFAYRFEAYWRPVEAFPLESRLVIGNEPPSNAVRQSVKLSMPLYAGNPPRDTLLACVNDSRLEAALNTSDRAASLELSEAFNDSLDAAAQEGAQSVVGLLLPSDLTGSAFGTETDESFQTLLSGVSENSRAENTSLENMFNENISGKLASGFQLGPAEYAQNISAADLTLLKEQLTRHIREELRTELESEYSGEINRTVNSICKAKNLSEAQTHRDLLIESVYRQVNPGGARIVLSLWSPVR